LSENILLDKFELLHDENVTEYRDDNAVRQLSPTYTSTKVMIKLISKEWKYLETFMDAAMNQSIIAFWFDNKGYNLRVTNAHPYEEFTNPSIEIEGYIKWDGRKPEFRI
jgi:hypothetical protein